MLRSSLLRSAPAGLAVALVLTTWTGCRSAATPPPTPTPGPPSTASPAPAASPSAPSPPYRNTVRWTTASEVDSFGFDIFRGESEAGPFIRLNAKPIAGAGTSDESHAYAFVDDTIDPTKDYYYYVESISITGEREKFTPVNRARAKLPPAPPPAP